MKRVLIYLSLAALVSACGIQGTAEDTLQQVKETNSKTEKMVGTTQDMKDLTQKMAANTQELKELTQKVADLTQKLLLKTEDLDKLTKEVAETTARLVELTKQLNGGMDKTNDGVRLQTMTLSLQTLLADVNTESLTPPALMLPAATKFGEVASSNEIMQVYYTYLTDAKVGLHDASGLRARNRLKSYRAAAAIVGMAPEAKFQEILRDQIVKRGEYEGTAYELAASRYNSIRNYLFLPITDSERTTRLNETILRKAVNLYQQLKAIAQLPYAKDFTVTVPQILPDPNAPDPKPGEQPTYIDSTENVDPGDLSALSQAALEAFNSRLTKTDLEQASVKALLQQLAP